MLGLDLRDGVQVVVGYASRDLSSLWARVSGAAQAREALHDILPALVERYGAAAAALAADWYDDQREKAGVRGSFGAIPAANGDAGSHSLVQWATATASSDEALRALILGGVQRRVANFSRLTVAGSAVADPQARGWQRVGNGECAFCDMLIGRGSVYTDASAGFAAHDSCRCSAVPAWGGRPVPVKAYTPSERVRTDTARARDRARVREYLRTL